MYSLNFRLFTLISIILLLEKLLNLYVFRLRYRSWLYFLTPMTKPNPRSVLPVCLFSVCLSVFVYYGHVV